MAYAVYHRRKSEAGLARASCSYCDSVEVQGRLVEEVYFAMGTIPSGRDGSGLDQEISLGGSLPQYGGNHPPYFSTFTNGNYFQTCFITQYKIPSFHSAC